jgi:hypothetical protein
MVKVTGGGGRVGAVSAHLGYISRQGKLELETDEGERIKSRDEHKTLLKSWHLELSAGQYRRQTERPPDFSRRSWKEQGAVTPPAASSAMK